MDIEPRTQVEPALQMPVAAVPVLRPQAPGGSTPGQGVEAAGLGDLLAGLPDFTKPYITDCFGTPGTSWLTM